MSAARRPNRLAPEADAKPRSVARGDVPERLLDRYLVERDRQGRPERFFRDHRAEHPSIRDGGQRLWAATDYPDAVADLLSIARHRGWTRLKVDGSEAFRREVWIQARREGLEVTGYRPRQRDRQAGGEPPPQPPPSLAADLETRLRQAGAVLKALVPDAAVRERLMAAARGRARDHERRRDRDR
ncbi:LPD7 domain-containing protein [Brevundimonas sp. GCM10030266]|uniref:LPD7 domain-containing protein n=1 Tax=Brevundimonas sp. GCM10030266 TaxID=3273386 RepID=UPI00360AE98D